MGTRRLHLASSVTNFTLDWKRGTGDRIISAPERVGCEVLWVVWEQDSTFLYDQIIRVERPGVVFLPIHEKKVGLMQVFRPQARNQKKLAKDFPNIDVTDLGKTSWEIPRGFGKMNESSTKTMEREVQEETGGRVFDCKWHPATCDNTTMSPHMTKLIVGQIDLSAPNPENDPFEPILAQLSWFSRFDLQGMRQDGELYCGYTLSAIASVLLDDPSALI